MTSETGPRRLLLLRHAKAEHPESIPDIQRPLSLVGRKQSTKVGAAVAADDLVPDLVLCSSSVRTRQTWDLVRSSLGTDPDVRYLDDLYYAGSSALVELVRAVPADVRTVLVVGHEPTMSQAARPAGRTGLRPGDARPGPGRRADRQLVAAGGRRLGHARRRDGRPAQARGPSVEAAQDLGPVDVAGEVRAGRDQVDPADERSLDQTTDLGVGRRSA